MTVSTNGGLIVDTGVVSALIFRDPNKPPSAWLQTVLPTIDGQSLVCSYISMAEVLYGAYNVGLGPDKINQILELFGQFTIVWPNDALVHEYAMLRASLPKNHRLRDKPAEADRWIAATALMHGLPLVTGDNGFANVPGLHHIYHPPLSNRASAAQQAPSVAPERPEDPP